MVWPIISGAKTMCNLRVEQSRSQSRTSWLPEQYPTECRASAFAFSTSFARFGGAGITFLVGSGVRHYGSLGMPVALTSIAFALGLLLIPFSAETRGKPLPS
jgi:hypothetical protein